MQYIEWANNSYPAEWPASDDPETTAKINEWLKEAGTAPGNYEMYRHLLEETE